jgi:hypothetical protein
MEKKKVDDDQVRDLPGWEETERPQDFPDDQGKERTQSLERLVLIEP